MTHQEELLREEWPLSCKRMPCAKRESSVLARLDSQEVNAAQSRPGQDSGNATSAAHEHLASEGKALKGPGKQASGGDAQAHVLPGSEVQTRMVLQQCPIGEKRECA